MTRKEAETLFPELKKHRKIFINYDSNNNVWLVGCKRINDPKCSEINYSFEDENDFKNQVNTTLIISKELEKMGFSINKIKIINKNHNKEWY